MSPIIGISQKTKRAWLDALLDRLVVTTDAAELREFLDQSLAEELPGPESRSKSSGILLRIWSRIPAESLSLRDRAVALLPQITGQERLWLHWGMTTLAYPFFRDLTGIVGRLLALQEEITTAQIQNRLIMTWGDRATSREAAQKLLNTLTDWQVLQAIGPRARFRAAPKQTASQPELELWLLEALLHASAADEIEAQQLLRLPEAFPFRLSVGLAELRRYEGFDIHRQGLDMDMVALRPAALPPKPAPKAKAPKAKKTPAAKAQLANLFDQPLAASPADEVPQAYPPATPIRVAAPPVAAQMKPNNPFGAAAAECARLFQTGSYFGCIAITQALITAMLRHIGQLRLKWKPNRPGSFEKDLAVLHQKLLMSDQQKARLDTLSVEWRGWAYLQWTGTDDQQRLKVLAHQGVELLNELEQGLFR